MVLVLRAVPHRLEEGKSASEDAGARRRVGCANKDAGPQKEVVLGAVPHRLEEGKSASEDAGARRRVDCDVPRWLGRRTNHHL